MNERIWEIWFHPVGYQNIFEVDVFICRGCDNANIKTMRWEFEHCEINHMKYLSGPFVQFGAVNECDGM